ncbi:unnamed protein product [Caenorhabditis angaria]|uniref:Peptidase M13 C-terminal domain-containing protein n=1 Tax=Caenorhabditis angaria TaxID=860376 RepID=A0A9P1IVY4_9PELO|nr:unnamed protein product [Caenorhabditis angaria]
MEKKEAGTRKYLIFGAALTIFAIILILVSQNSESSNSKSPKVLTQKSSVSIFIDSPTKKIEQICRTPECIQLGNRIKTLMNPKIKPCDDFYEFACGNFANSSNFSSEASIIRHGNRRKLRELVKIFEPITKSERILKIFLEKCGQQQIVEPIFARNSTRQIFWKNASFTQLLIEVSQFFSEDPEQILINSIFHKKNIFYLKLRTGNKYRPKNNKYSRKLVDFREIPSPKFMNLTQYIQFLLPETERKLAENWKVLVVQKEFEALEKYLRNKMNLKSARKMLKKLWKEKLELYLVKKRKTSGCFKKAEKLFRGTLSMMFLNKFVGLKTVEKANNFFEEIRNEFIEQIEKSTWIDKKSKKLLKDEAKVLNTSIGIPDEYKNLENIDKMYSRIEKPENQSYLELVENLLKMNMEETFLRVAQAQKMTYYAKSLVHSPNFHPISFRVSYSAFDLTYPKIHENLPDWNMKMILGRTLGHAFDAKKFVKNHEHIEYPKKKMNRKTRKEFDRRIGCLISQYDKFEFPDGSKSSGKRTKNEDSADKIGFDLAFRILQRDLRNSNEIMEKLQGLEEFSIEQNWFLRFGYHYCQKPYDEKAIEIYKDEVHSAEKFRVNGIVMNSPEFSKAFQCKPGSLMNPKEKCQLFDEK